MKRRLQQCKIVLTLLAGTLGLAACGGSQSGATDTANVVASSFKATQFAAVSAQHETPVPIADGSGTVLTVSSAGFIDHSNLFFTPLGNGRSCNSCHQEAQAWSVTPAALQTRFAQSQGTDPIFQLVDGANSPNASVATLAQKQVAYSMLLNKGVIRVGLPIPSGAEFQLVAVDDPYGFATAAELSLFRRPLPATNLKFESTVMWDGRETLTNARSNLCLANTAPAACFDTVNFDLLDQANSAATGHAQLVGGLTAAQQTSVVGFESGLFTAQASDNQAGSLSAGGADGGPQFLSTVPFYFGINDFINGDYQTKAPFSRSVMTLFSAWGTAALPPLAPPPAPPRPGALPPPPPQNTAAAAKASIARGEQIFNTRPFNIVNVGGLNDVLQQPTVRGTCSTCHDTPNAGSLSVPRLLNTGVAAAVVRTPDLPLYTLKNISTGATLQTSDPGRALVTGKWSDVGSFKVPGLRALAARAPYFHNGSRATLGDVVNFYDKRFQIGFSPQEAADLTAFLQAL